MEKYVEQRFTCKVESTRYGHDAVVYQESPEKKEVFRRRFRYYDNAHKEAHEKLNLIAGIAHADAMHNMIFSHVREMMALAMA